MGQMEKGWDAMKRSIYSILLENKMYICLATRFRYIKVCTRPVNMINDVEEKMTDQMSEQINTAAALTEMLRIKKGSVI